MNVLYQESQEFYCYPVERHGERFVESQASLFLGIDRPRLTEMEDYLERHYRTITADVEIEGRSFRTSVYVPKDASDQSYVVADKSGLPPDAVSEHRVDTETANAYYEFLHRKLSYSESISPGQASYLDTEFMTPSFIDVTNSLANTHKQVRTWQEVKKISRLVLLGEPGAGKTTCLRKLTLEVTNDYSSSSHPVIPIYLQLRELQLGTSLFQEIAHALALYPTRFEEYGIELLAQSGQLLLVLDGLDEVEEKARIQTRDRLQNLTQAYPQMKILISTRMEGYDWYIEGFTHLELQPFPVNVLQEWTYQKLYSHEDKSWRKFISLLVSEYELVELAKNPLMLSLIVFLYTYNSLVPNSKVSIVGKFVEVLVELWDSVRGVYRNTEDWASPTRKLDALCRSAFALRMTGNSTFTEKDFLDWQYTDLDTSSKRALLKVLVAHTGLIRESGRFGGENQITFSHDTIVDYLAARYIIKSTSDAIGIISVNLYKRRWHSVWEYACGMTTDASDLLSLMLHHEEMDELTKAVLSAKALAQVTNLNETVLIETCRQIESTLDPLFREFGWNLEAETSLGSSSSIWKLALNIEKKYLRRHGDHNAFESEFEQLIKAIHNARSGYVGLTLKQELLSSNNHAIVKFASCLDIDGELRCHFTSSKNQSILTIEIFGSEPDNPNIGDLTQLTGSIASDELDNGTSLLE